MANELNIDLFESGLTVTATLIQGNVAVGSPVTLTESGTVPGHYSGNMPSVAAGLYLVRFESGGVVGNGEIDWDGTAERRLLSSPTVAQLEARTLPSAAYFDPATDAVATVTNLTNLPAMPADWLTAAGLSAGAVAEIQAGLSTLTSANVRTEADAALAAVGVTSTVTSRIDAAISTRSTYNGSDTPGTTTLVSRLTSTRAGYLDTIPTLLTSTTYTASLPQNFASLVISTGGAITAGTVNDKTGYSLSASQAFNLTGNISGSVGSVVNAVTLPAIPTDWITAAGVSAEAVTKIQSGLSTLTTSNVRTEADAALAAVSLTSVRTGYLDKLNVSGTLAHSDAAVIYQADISGLLTTNGFTAAIPTNFAALSINSSGYINRVVLVDTTTTNTDMRGTDGAVTSIGNVTVGGYAIGQSPTDLVTGFATSAEISAIPTNPLLTNDVRLDNLDASISSRSDFDASSDSVIVGDKTGFSLSSGGVQAIWNALTSALTTNNSIGKLLVDNIPGISTLLGRLTSDRAGYLDKLNVTGTLANTDNASTFRATGFSTFNPLIDSVIVGSYATGQSPATLVNLSGLATTTNVTDARDAVINAGLTASQVWSYGDRLLTGSQATNLSTITLIPTNPLLANDSRIDAVKAKTDQLIFSGGDIVATLASEEVTITSASVNAIVTGVDGAITVPTAVEIREEMDDNSTKLAEIKTIAIGAKNTASAGL